MLMSPLGWLFINPLPFDPMLRLWMLLPLVACVAVVYRATRARTVTGMLRPTFFTFANIVVGMVLIAAAFYGVNMIVRHAI